MRTTFPRPVPAILLAMLVLHCSDGPGSVAPPPPPPPPSSAVLVFRAGPSDAFVGQPFVPVVQVAAVDRSGNLATDFRGSVTIALSTNPSGASLAGTTTVSAIGGVAAFTGLSLDRPGAGYTLTASAVGLTSATSAGFEIVAPASVEIVFVRGYDLYATNAAGSFQIRLTNTSSSNFPHWSPDGSKIAFDGNGGINGGIYVTNADGSGQVNLTNSGVSGGGTVWSPDGRKIAFISNRDGWGFQIYVMNADGSGLTRLTHDSASDVQPTWSPDGSKIAFASGTSRGTRIFVMNADGTGVVALTDSSQDYLEPAWSPDGSKIAFSDVFNAALWVMNADGTGATAIAAGGQPQWSPDGSKIAFYRVTRTNRQLCSQSPCTQTFYVINADGSGLLQLPSPSKSFGGVGCCLGPTWSPDGSRLAFVPASSDGSRELFVVNADGSGLVNVTKSTGAGFSPVWKPR